jgi:RNA polymerase sigma-70 factor (ECF subfamily)
MQSKSNFQINDEQIPSDRELIESALNGDETGFEQLVQRYQARLVAAMRRNVGSLEMAEDIVQDAFTKAFLHLTTFRRDANFYTWLYRIALNSRRDYFRKLNGTVSLDSFDHGLPLAASQQRNSPSAAAERREDCTMVRAALSRLKTRNQTILVMREFELLDYETIAQRLQIPMGTVRSRLCRARAELRHELASYHQASSQ